MSALSLWAAAGGAALLHLVDLALSVMTLSASALSRVALRRMNAESGNRLAFLDEFKTVPSSHRAAIHILRQLALVFAVGLWGWMGAQAPWPGGWWTGIAVGAFFGAFLVETVLARMIALKDPRLALRSTAILIRPVHAITYPVLAPVHAAFRRWAGTIADEDDDEGLDEDVEAFIEVGEREGILEKLEGRMVRGIVDLDTTLVREVMTPRVDVVTLPMTSSISDARVVALTTGHSRFPVYGETIDTIGGMLHVRDLVRAWDEGWAADTTIGGLVRPAVFVPDTRTVAEVLGEMRTRGHAALVVDEYGGFAGMVTLEDLVEEIVGEIRDEHEHEHERSDTSVKAEPGGSWLVSGAAHAEELERVFGVDLGERDYDTVAGFVTAALGRVPAKGETFAHAGLRVEIVDANPRRVRQVRVAAEPSS